MMIAFLLDYLRPLCILNPENQLAEHRLEQASMDLLPSTRLLPL